MNQDIWTWIGIGVPFVLCIGTALLLTLYVARRKKPDA